MICIKKNKKQNKEIIFMFLALKNALFFHVFFGIDNKFIKPIKSLAQI